jgi:hypothetical protein
VTGAFQRTEAALRAAYEKATHKTRNTADYEEALWALADSTSDKRQISQIYDSSYKWVMLKRRGRKLLTREQLNQRYLSMRKDSHARIVAGSRSSDRIPRVDFRVSMDWPHGHGTAEAYAPFCKPLL